MDLLLRKQGYSNFLIEVGGELVGRGVNGRGQKWTVGIEKPSYAFESTSVQEPLALNDKAVATSGDYRNFFVDDNGKRYSHIINPKTGYPVTHQAASVTVVAKSAMEADAWATASSCCRRM
ncbi:MAG: FAD:protein FMN transferase [Pseudolabrys sp.]